MTLEEQFRNGLAGQLSDDKTNVDIRVAADIARNFSKGFAEWCGIPIVDYNVEQLLKTFENEVLNK